MYVMSGGLIYSVKYCLAIKLNKNVGWWMYINRIYLSYNASLGHTNGSCLFLRIITVVIVSYLGIWSGVSPCQAYPISMVRWIEWGSLVGSMFCVTIIWGWWSVVFLMCPFICPVVWSYTIQGSPWQWQSSSSYHRFIKNKGTCNSPVH